MPAASLRKKACRLRAVQVLPVKQPLVGGGEHEGVVCGAGSFQYSQTFAACIR